MKEVRTEWPSQDPYFAMKRIHSLLASLPCLLIAGAAAISTSTRRNVQLNTNQSWDGPHGSSSRQRRIFLAGLVSSLPLPLAANAVERAVGSAEAKCREEGNCLQTLDLDGAVGWNWGAKDRCDSTDPRCGADGVLNDAPPAGKPVPDKQGLQITDVVSLELQIGTGSNADTQILKIGLYGENCPTLVEEMKELCSKGIVTSSDLLLGAPVRLGVGGQMTYIRPEQRVEFGVPSQKIAYAKAMRQTKAPDEFVPQARPSGMRFDACKNEKTSRLHDVAGLLSVPKGGIGFGSSSIPVKDDDAYSSCFQITASSLPDADKEERKVIGQLIDSKSMELLARLSSIPTRKALPTQSGGSPLIKTIVNDVRVDAVSDLLENKGA